MARPTKPPITQRAYTLRLRGVEPHDNSWRKALWQTHEAVNNGAKVFGDWLLTLRGGLDHGLADAKVKVGKGESKHERDPEPQERKARRILLALSWLSVESERGAPVNYIVARGAKVAGNRNMDDGARNTSREVVGALRGILKGRRLQNDEINEWVRDCTPSLSAAIREDAVWVNRSNAFDDAARAGDGSLTRTGLWDMLAPFFGSDEAYLAPVKSSDEESSEVEPEEKAKDLVQKAGQWLSSRFGAGEGADFRRFAAVYERIKAWADQAGADQAVQGTTGRKATEGLAEAFNEFKYTPKSKDVYGVLELISGPGYKSATRNCLESFNQKMAITRQDLSELKEKAAKDAEKSKLKIGSKGPREYANVILKEVEKSCGFTYLRDGERNRHSEFAVILDHAARRVSLAHTWIKRAESERREFEKDIECRGNVPIPVKDWLDAYCLERSGSSGAAEPYRIRRRAISGWKQVVDAWNRDSCRSSADRIAAARALQDDPEIDKFGDIQLFEALAGDDALCAWRKDGDPTKAPDPQPLIDYVLATEAEAKQRRFKVPAYRHPDALLHPVFCDFGKSRWNIRFEAQRDRETPNPRVVCLALRTDAEIKPVSLCWQSKRLAGDVALGQSSLHDRAREVTRADRLGRAASDAAKRDEVKISGLFEHADWNGRLQAPRRQLEAIAKMRDNNELSSQERDRRTTGMTDRIRWLVTFSAKLQPMGPWCEFANQSEELQLNPDTQRWPHGDINKSRKGHAKLVLSRLPGVRVLSVDLGHRYAAACAVWEAQSAEQVKEACQKATHKEPTESDLYLHLKRTVTNSKEGNPAEVEKTTIYRRIGADLFPDGTPYPTPWARLERQFLIKLQGEAQGARAASNQEIWEVHQLEARLGRSAPIIDCLVKAGWGEANGQRARLEALRALGWKPASGAGNVAATNQSANDIRKPSLSVDELMASAVRTLRIALQRHGDRARIAHYLITNEKIMPGGRTQALDYNGRVDLLVDALTMWHSLHSSRGWRDEAARQLWDENIARLAGYQAPEEFIDCASRVERKKQQQQNQERFRGPAEALAPDDALRATLHAAWKKRWEEDDRQWRRHLRWFKDWALPRGKHGRDPAIRKTGGLALTRLATLTEFRRKVQVGFYNRLRPDNTLDETPEHFGQRALDAIEHLREQRVKQLASRIAEAALGIGRVKRSSNGKDPKRPDFRVDQPCHAVVIENLTHYRPEETRTRRENRQLMSWASSKVKKYLSEACQLHGLHLREVPASYTSRQDSRTGAPGIRCQDVPVNEFMKSPFWRKQVGQAEAKRAGDHGNARERYLCNLNERWMGKTATEWTEAGVVRIPVSGGEIFVSADPGSSAARGLQADLNAAANIGLRALIDPDWPGKWWYVPCNTANFRPAIDKVDGCTVVKPDQALRHAAQEPGGDIAQGKKKVRERSGGKSKEIVNLWRDISAFPLANGEPGEWRDYTGYWNSVQCRVIGVLEQKGPRRGRITQPHDGAGEPPLPF